MVLNQTNNPQPGRERWKIYGLKEDALIVIEHRLMSKRVTIGSAQYVERK
jgi:hypothetical protein